MKALLVLAVLAASLTTPAFPADTCRVGLVKASIGTQPFSWVMSGEGTVAQMDCTEAQHWADVLNVRHNNDANGVEPVVASVYRS